MIVIPAIDLIDGKCVRLTQGDYSQVQLFNSDPIEQAKLFEKVVLNTSMLLIWMEQKLEGQ